MLRLAAALVLTAVMAADYAPLQGAWKATQLNGAPLAGQGVDLVITITGDKYTVAQNGAVNERGAVRIDTTKSPMTMDLLIAEGEGAGSTQLGVFAVKGDTMTTVLANPGETARPTSLAVGAAALHVIAVRQK